MSVAISCLWQQVQKTFEACCWSPVGFQAIKELCIFCHFFHLIRRNKEQSSLVCLFHVNKQLLASICQNKTLVSLKLHMDQYFPVWTQKLHNSLNLSLLHSATYFYCIVSNCHICWWKKRTPLTQSTWASFYLFCVILI